MKSLNEGPEHYKTNKIQPIEFILSNSLDFARGNVVKYVTRDRRKNGAEDLKKAMHYLQICLENDYAISSEISYEDTSMLEEDFFDKTC